MALSDAGQSADAIALMELAFVQAKLALDNLEVPVGCVITEKGKVISNGRNRTTETRNATRHAEMEAIDALLDQWKKNGLSPTEVAVRFSNCSLYVTCEPCIMCASALSFLGIKEVYYGCSNDKFGGCGSILSLHRVGSGSSSRGFKCTGGVMASEAVSLLRIFYEQGNPNVENWRGGKWGLFHNLFHYLSEKSSKTPSATITVCANCRELIIRLVGELTTANM